MRFATSLLVLTISGTSWAGAALDDDKKAPPVQPNPQPSEATATEAPAATDSEEAVHYAVDLRLRNVRVPQFMLDWFVSHSAGGASNFGYGLDFVRRRGDLEVALGIEFEHITIGEGVYVESNKTVPADPADFILSPEHTPTGESLGWFTIDFTFLKHTKLNDYVALRYGGGAGLGILTGGLYRYDVACAPGSTNSNLEPGCRPTMLGGTGQTSNDDNGAPEASPVKYNLPPVFPVINAIIGVQIKPFDKAVINIEAGIRTIPFIGVSLGYFLN